MRTRSILLVEDDRDIQDALREALELEGYRVNVANEGAQGLEKLGSNSAPDLILLDLMMPGMDGKEFLSRLAVSSHYGIPVIVLTASQEPLPKGALKLIRKPFSLDALIMDIERIFTQRDRALHSVAIPADA